MANKKKRLDYICRQLGIKLRTFEPNPYKQELFDKYNITSIADCSIRTLCRILNLEYDEAYKIMMEETNELHLPSVGYVTLLARILELKGYVILSFKKYRISIAEFMHINKNGRYVLIYDDHAFAYINGTWYDSDSILNFADGELPYKLNYVICESKYANNIYGGK